MRKGWLNRGQAFRRAKSPHISYKLLIYKAILFMGRQEFTSILDLLEKMSSEELEDQVRSLRSSR